MAQEIADSTLLDTWASSGLIVEPDVSKIIEGWQLGEQPPHEYMNWLQNTFGSKLNHILKNGVATWNNTTQYLAGATAQHTGNVWLCKTTNTNSAPTDANANWKRIITVESLTTVLNDYVNTTSTQTIGGAKTFSSNPLSTASQSTNANALTKYSAVVKNIGDETIAGVKTFSSSPIVPTPTAGTQVANKDYADTKQSKSELAYNIDTSSYIPNTLLSGAIIEKGSNATGEYIKYADGTLICRNIEILILTGYNNGVYRQINFPHAFFNDRYSLSVYGWRDANDNAMFFLRGGSIHNINSFNITTSTTNSSLGTQFDYVAIGRWK